MRTLISLLLLLVALPAAADVYRWVDADGVVHYSDKAPSPDAKPTKLPSLQSFNPQALTAGQSLSGDAAPSGGAAPGYRPVITSPGADETLRENVTQVTISVAASPPNQSDKLVYYVDGSAQGSPTTSTSMTIDNVERGTHTAAVAAVDSQGKEYARSATVTFHMKQPVVQQNRPNAPKPKKPK
jgi:hypothetical protein